jgi:hypothetical protein
MLRNTIADMYLNGEYNAIIEMTIYSCDCKSYKLPLDNYLESVDGDIYEYCEDWFTHVYLDEYDRTEIVDNNLVLINEPVEKCDDCRFGKTYMKDMPRPIGFEDVYKMHGIMAYGRDNTDFFAAKEHLHKVLNNPGYETCCSTEAIGNVGVVLEGDVILASNCDLGSKVDEGGRYFYADTEDASYIIYNADDLTFGTNGMNDEIVTINNKIKSVWYKEHSNNKEKQFAKELAEYYNVPLIEEPSTDNDLFELGNSIYF